LHSSPELVWESQGDNQLGFVPMGRPIDFRQTADVSRNIVNGLVDGLEHLHKLKIIHRDIRPSNLILNHENNVIIIDYETSVTDVEYVEYSGGFIWWQKRLLEEDAMFSTHQPADDLFACILVVLHMLFPSRFDAFHAGCIGIHRFGQLRHTNEMQQLLNLWEDIEQSKIWGRFMKAAQGRN
jgi:serine/threonine protein kinase